MTNKVAIITGASSGIGKALAFKFSQENYNVVLAARRIQLLEEIKHKIEQQGGNALAVQADVSNEADCKKIIELTLEKYKQIDVLINNAGISMRALFEEVDLNVLHTLMNVNFWGTVYCSYYALPELIKNKGSLVAISSVAGFQGLPARCGYSASKFAIHGLMETIRIENLYSGLHTLIVCPGFTESEIRYKALDKMGNPQGESPLPEEKLASAEQVAKSVFNAIKKRKNLLILSIEGKSIYHLKHLVPGFVDRQIFKSMFKEPNSPLKNKFYETS